MSMNMKKWKEFSHSRIIVICLLAMALPNLLGLLFVYLTDAEIPLQHLDWVDFFSGLLVAPLIETIIFQFFLLKIAIRYLKNEMTSVYCVAIFFGFTHFILTTINLGNVLNIIWGGMCLNLVYISREMCKVHIKFFIVWFVHFLHNLFGLSVMYLAAASSN
jgi:hypothetical protein